MSPNHKCIITPVFIYPLTDYNLSNFVVYGIFYRKWTISINNCSYILKLIFKAKDDIFLYLTFTKLNAEWMYEQ